MQVIGQWIIDGVDFRVSQQFFIRAVGTRDTQFTGDGFRQFPIAGSQRDDLAERALLHGGNDLDSADFCGAQNAPANAFAHDVPVV